MTKLIYIVLNPAQVPSYGMSTRTNKLTTDFGKISRHRGAKAFI